MRLSALHLSSYSKERCVWWYTQSERVKTDTKCTHPPYIAYQMHFVFRFLFFVFRFLQWPFNWSGIHILLLLLLHIIAAGIYSRWILCIIHSHTQCASCGYNLIQLLSFQAIIFMSRSHSFAFVPCSLYNCASTVHRQHRQCVCMCNVPCFMFHVVMPESCKWTHNYWLFARISAVIVVQPETKEWNSLSHHKSFCECCTVRSSLLFNGVLVA